MKNHIAGSIVSRFRGGGSTAGRRKRVKDLMLVEYTN